VSNLFATQGAPSLSNLYQGYCYLLSASSTSKKLIDLTERIVRKHYQGHEPSEVHKHFSNRELMDCLQRCRKELVSHEQMLILQAGIVEELGWTAADFLCDVPRLRMIVPFMHVIEAAKPAFYAHRDTWYANPEEQINIWIPVADYDSSETFTLYPQFFAQKIANDSSTLDYKVWKKEIGFQQKKPVRPIYPKALSLLPEVDAEFSCQRAQRFVFSAQHLHRTRENRGDRCRFSVDFRVLHKDDFRHRRGPVNVDSAVIGSVVEDYVSLPSNTSL